MRSTRLAGFPAARSHPLAAPRMTWPWMRGTPYPALAWTSLSTFLRAETAESMSDSATPVQPHGAHALSRVRLLFAFGRLQLPAVLLSEPVLAGHLERTYVIYASKEGDAASWTAYWSRLYPLDWYLACGCLERSPDAWQRLFALRASASDALLIDALRLRAVRLYPRDLERQESAVSEY